jgi:hypothetical protein
MIVIDAPKVGVKMSLSVLSNLEGSLAGDIAIDSLAVKARLKVLLMTVAANIVHGFDEF